MYAIRSFDPASAAAAEWHALHAFRRLRHAEDLGDDPLEADDEFELSLRRQLPLYESRRWYAWRGGDMVGNIGVSFRRAGTSDFEDHEGQAYGWGGVQRNARRKGIATALLAPLAAFMCEQAVRLVSFTTYLDSGRAFLFALCGEARQTHVENRLDLAAVDAALLDRWRDAAVAESGLTWEIYPQRVAPERMSSLAEGLTVLQADIPLGGLEAPPMRSEPQQWMSWYEDLDRHGGDHLLVALTDSDGVAAVCEAAWDARWPDRAYTQFTGVARHWRGRGLAKAVKAKAIQLLQERRPSCRLIVTGNADENAAMLAVNRQLGFAVHRRTATYQAGLERIEAFLAARPTIR